MDQAHSTVSRFVHRYRGIEGFYFLNQRGELGYIDSKELKSVKETFPQLSDRAFLKKNPQFIVELEGFLRDLGDLSALYLTGDQHAQLELGYVLPPSENQRWRSATLVLHKQVIDTLRADERLLHDRHDWDPLTTDWPRQKLEGVRSVYRGLDDLVHHQDSAGSYKYFPVFFYLPQNDSTASSADRARLRVLNLRWRTLQTMPDQNAETPPDSWDNVFALLRENLAVHGALHRARPAVA